MMMTDSMEQLQEINQTMEELEGRKKSKWETAGQFGGGWIGNHILKKVSGVVKDRIDKSDPIQRFDQKLARWVENPDELINLYQNLDRVKNADLEEGPISKAYQVFGDFLGLFKDSKREVTGESGYGIENLSTASYTDDKVRRAQVDVIPGYLARILREVTVLRTNDNNLALTVYDFDSGQFKTETKLSDDIRKSLQNKFKTSSFGSAKTAVADQFLKYRDWETDRKSTRLNSSHSAKSRMPSSA